MSDSIKHECGVALLRLLKPLDYYKEKYGSLLYGLDKMYLLMEKQHNRGQDGAGLACVKFDMEPGERYISRIRSMEDSPIKDIFHKIHKRVEALKYEYPNAFEDTQICKNHLPYIGELFLGHVRYGTSGKNLIENVHPFLRQNNWKHRNLIVAGNFNMTNVDRLFEKLVAIGQHPKEKIDTITIMEKIGHFLDDAVSKIYKDLKAEGFSKKEASPLIAARLKIDKILRKASKKWDGGYTMCGLLGHGDSFVFRDPWGIRPCYYYYDEEIVVAASERPALQTAFGLEISQVKELPPGHALITKYNGEIGLKEIIPPFEKKPCSFERIYFSRGNDADIYHERQSLGKFVFPAVMEKIDGDLGNTVLSYIPNTAEIAFMGLVKAAQNHLTRQKIQNVLLEKDHLTEALLEGLLKVEPRIEKIAVKDAKLRTFIAEDRSRQDMVTHVYDITYGVVKPTDHLVVLDDSIVRGTTLKNSILKILSRLKPKQIVVVSSAPQIRYLDCYGIDMARLGDLVAFRAALALHEKNGRKQETVDRIYQNCKAQMHLPDEEISNAVKDIYEPFTDQQISDQMADMLSEKLPVKVSILFQTVENLHKACPNHTGDWYFTGNYPTPGGNRVANKAFINFYEGVEKRAYL